MLALRAYIRKEKRSEINDVSFHILKKNLEKEKEKQISAKMSKRKKIVKKKKSKSIPIK